MKWWPFKKPQKKVTIHDSKIHVKGTRIWLQNLQEICEKNFDNPPEAKRLIRQMQIEWKEAAKLKEIDLELIEGLDRRAFYLLKADEKEWNDLLDNLKFWRPGWKAD
ncbi:MAG: Uncharacterised protein [Methanobacteriota archaeon]|nr:MAG: Uncharacterised protein [Euryarchaeota archaeon]